METGFAGEIRGVIGAERLNHNAIGGTRLQVFDGDGILSGGLNNRVRVPYHIDFKMGGITVPRDICGGLSNVGHSDTGRR